MSAYTVLYLCAEKSRMTDINIKGVYVCLSVCLFVCSDLEPKLQDGSPFPTKKMAWTPPPLVLEVTSKILYEVDLPWRGL